MKHRFDPPPGAQVHQATKGKADAIESKIHQMLLKLPLLPKPKGNYLPLIQIQKWLYLSGQLPLEDNSLKTFRGKVGREVPVDIAQRAAKQCTLNALALAKNHLGSLEKIKRVIKLTGFVAAMPGFQEQAAVLNGASDFLVELFGDAGKHVRSAIGVTDLPMGACVEIEYVFEVK